MVNQLNRITQFYKMMSELIRNQCDVANHQVNVQFLLQLQPKWQRFEMLVKQSQELKTVSYYKLYDILRQHHNKVNEIRAERLARTANPLANLFSTTTVYHLKTTNHYTQNSLLNHTQAATRNKKIYKPTNNNLRTSSNTNRANQDNTPRINRGTGYDNQRTVNVAVARENVGTQMICRNKFDWKDDTDDEPKDQELEAHYMYMAQIQEVTPDNADNSGPIFDVEPLQKVQNNHDNSNVISIENEHPKKPKFVNVTYPVDQDKHNIIIDSLDMIYDREQDDRDDDDLANERNLLASFIEKLKCEIDDSKNRNKFLESSDKTLVDKLKGKIEDFKNKNKSLESSNNHFKEANNELSKTNQLMFKDLKKFQTELDRYHDVNYASKVAIDYAKAKRDLIFVKPEFLKKAQRVNPRLYDIGFYKDNLALMLALDSDETICLAKESRSKLSDLIRSFDYKNLNNLYDLFVPQREKLPE
ncbi:hypothetical protein Tco_0726881 [Tanacetum coccineum]|uniref:Gag-Pol polyprotein n=1 Tax=Tanacetum coccineum TaxID=301880 RepID=A0ABQ4YHS9_9ASTR